MLNNKQVSELKKGIKLAVKHLNLDGDLLFFDNEKEIRSVEKKINNIVNKEKSYLIELGYSLIMNDKSILKLNLQDSTIHNFIYSRKENEIFDSLDINELITLNNKL